MDRVREKFKENGINAVPRDHTPILNWLPRGIEIQKWIKANVDSASKFHYVILDDDSDMLYGQRDHFVKTSFTYGGLRPWHREKIEKAFTVESQLTYDKATDANRLEYEKHKG